MPQPKGSVMPKPSVTRVSAATDIDKICAVIDRDGAVVISGLLAKADLAKFNDELKPHFEQAKFCEGLFFGPKTKRVHSLIAKSAICRDVTTHPIVLKIMNHLLGGFCEKIQLNLTQGIQIWPGEAAQFLHRDDAMFPAQARACELMANAMWACSPFTKQNGATVVVPGSHKWEDKQRRPEDSETTQAEMDPGDVLIYLGSVIHAGGENFSSQPRTGIAIGYCLGWLRQYENQYFAAPPEVARHFTPELQDLLGYAVHRPNLGMYEGNEPKILFDRFEKQNLTTKDWLTPAQDNMVLHYVMEAQKARRAR